MTIKVRIKRPLFQAARPEYGAKLYNFTAPPSERTFIDTLAECAVAENASALKNQNVYRAPSPVQPQVKDNDSPSQTALRIRPAGPLSNLLSWLRSKYAQRPVRKLRVSETVSLGEKRFVAILQVDDRKYLIGGGASNVALLTALDGETPEKPSSVELHQATSRIRGIY